MHLSHTKDVRRHWVPQITIQWSDTGLVSTLKPGYWIEVYFCYFFPRELNLQWSLDA